MKKVPENNEDNKKDKEEKKDKENKEVKKDHKKKSVMKQVPNIFFISIFESGINKS